MTLSLPVDTYQKKRKTLVSVLVRRVGGNVDVSGVLSQIRYRGFTFIVFSEGLYKELLEGV